MSEAEVTKLIKLNMSNYPGRFLANASEQQISTMAATWWQLFANLPAEAVMNAYLQALKVCEFPVTPANIFAQLRQVQAAARPSVEELWRELVKASRACRRDAYGFDFTEGRKYRERCRQRFKALPECTREFIGSYGRMIDLGEMDAQEREQFYFPRFRRFAEQYWRNRETRQEPAGLTGGARLLGE